MVLRICIVLAADCAPGPGERRLIDALGGAARFDLACVAEAPGPAPDGSRAVRNVLAAERRAFPGPDTAPDPVIAKVPLATASETHHDVIVDFSHSDKVLTLAQNARHGIWRLSAFDAGAGEGEARDFAPVTHVTLRRHAPGQTPRVIGSAAYDTKFLATRNAALIREKSVQLVLQALARLAQDLPAEAATAPPPPAPRRLSARDLPRYAMATATRLSARALDAAGERIGRRPGRFHLRLCRGSPLTFDPAAGTDLHPPRDAFWADPFLFERDGTLYLFYEEYDYPRGLGHICAARLEGDRMIPLGVALKRPYHLSYPFVFRWQDEILMIPETHAAKRIEVWRATRFPTEWELANVAFEGTDAADTVVTCRDGAWWMFTSICQDSFGDHASDLHLFRIDSPMLNRITPHPLNPVVIDTTCARGGGRIFERDGRLFRSSQDKSHGVYGFGLNLMEITRLDDSGYSERRIRHIRPDFEPGIVGCHHMDCAGDRVVIDLRHRMASAPRLRASAEPERGA